MNKTQINKQLRRNFVVAVAITLFHVVLGYIISRHSYISVPQESVATVKTIIILFVLISIPLNLKWFNNSLQKLAQYTDSQKQAKDYIKFSRIRVFIVLIGLISAIMFFFIRGIHDMIYIIGIESIVLFLCIPTTKRVEQETAKFLPSAHDNQKIVNEDDICDIK